MLGRSVLPPNGGESEILMFSPDGRRADLRLADGRRIQFNVLIGEHQASFTPVGMVDETIPWRELIERRMSFSDRATAEDREPTVSAAHEAKEPRG
jgi:hypothetical protein